MTFLTRILCYCFMPSHGPFNGARVKDNNPLARNRTFLWIRRRLIRFVKAARIQNFETGHIVITAIAVKWLKYCRYDKNPNRSNNKSINQSINHTIITLLYGEHWIECEFSITDAQCFEISLDSSQFNKQGTKMKTLDWWIYYIWLIFFQK